MVSLALVGSRCTFVYTRYSGQEAVVEYGALVMRGVANVAGARRMPVAGFGISVVSRENLIQVRFS